MSGFFCYNKNMNKKGFDSLSLRGTKCRGNLGFTIMEILVVAIILGVLASIALPKYMEARDKAHISALMTIGKSVNEALDRRSVTDYAADNRALDKIDLIFKDYQGNTCSATATTCRILVSGKEYVIQPYLNYTGVRGRNFTYFNSYTNDSFGAFTVYTDTHSDDNYRLSCYLRSPGIITPDESRCVKIGLSFGATNPHCNEDYTGSIYCAWK